MKESTLTYIHTYNCIILYHLQIREWINPGLGQFRDGIATIDPYCNENDRNARNNRMQILRILKHCVLMWLKYCKNFCKISFIFNVKHTNNQQDVHLPHSSIVDKLKCFDRNLNERCTFLI